MINLDTFLQIRHEFHNEHRTISHIAQHLGLNELTVSKWSQKSEYARRKTLHRNSKLDSFKPTVLELLHEQGLSAKRIYAQLRSGGYRGGYTILKTFVRHQRVCVPVTPREFHAYRWMNCIMQDDIPLVELQNQFAGSFKANEVLALTSHIKTGPLRLRNKAVALLTFKRPISIRLISRFLHLNINTVTKWRKEFQRGGISAVLTRSSQNPKKSDLSQYREAVFSILHGPPSAYGFNRTSWRMTDIVRVKSKGSLILTAALELSENRVTHFYSEHKNTEEMLKLLETLLAEYAGQTCIFFSWDAASWHASKKTIRESRRSTHCNTGPPTKYRSLSSLRCLPALNSSTSLNRCLVEWPGRSFTTVITTPWTPAKKLLIDTSRSEMNTSKRIQNGLETKYGAKNGSHRCSTKRTTARMRAGSAHPDLWLEVDFSVIVS